MRLFLLLFIYSSMCALFCFCNTNYLTKNKWNLCTQNAFTDHFESDWSDKYKRVLANLRVIFLVEEHFWFTKTTFKNIDLTNIERSTKPHRTDLCWFQLISLLEFIYRYFWRWSWRQRNQAFQTRISLDFRLNLMR